MTINHHPSEEALAAFASGALDEGRSLLVSVHLSFCAGCRDAIHALAHLGGALLEGLAPVGLSTDLRSAAMARLGTQETVQVPVASADGLPAPLSAYQREPWQWVGPGIWRAGVALDRDEESRVLLLKAAAGTRLIDHGHSDLEWTCVLTGAFHHDHGHFGAGDFEEADPAVFHRPIVTPDAECICLVALRGTLRYSGWLGRLMQPLIRL